MEQQPNQFDIQIQNITQDEEDRIVREALKRETEIGLVQINPGQQQTIHNAAIREEDLDGKDF